MNVTGREPAVLLMALVTPLIQIVSALIFPLTDEQQGILNGLAAAILGFVTAALVSIEKALPMLAGLVQAVIACALAFGVEITPEVQTAILAIVAAVVGFFVRTQVSPKLSAGAAVRSERSGATGY